MFKRSEVFNFSIFFWTIIFILCHMQSPVRINNEFYCNWHLPRYFIRCERITIQNIIETTVCKELRFGHCWNNNPPLCAFRHNLPNFPANNFSAIVKCNKWFIFLWLKEKDSCLNWSSGVFNVVIQLKWEAALVPQLSEYCLFHQTLSILTKFCVFSYEVANSPP